MLNLIQIEIDESGLSATAGLENCGHGEDVSSDTSDAATQAVTQAVIQQYEHDKLKQKVTFLLLVCMFKTSLPLINFVLFLN